MARLNDPPAPPPESLEALKRRFIRQNREIARVNASQSQRIRNLEIEITRLLTENTCLKEQMIAAQAETQRWREARSVGREVRELKSRLEAKVKEVTALIDEMSEIPDKAVRRQSKRNTMTEKSNMLTEAEWKNRLATREAMKRERADILDGKLPNIVEDKLYPRRTLELAELVALKDEAAMQDATESPDLGPPPVAHFDVQEPIKFDASRPSDQELLEDVSQLPSILERRRRRRTSALLQDMPKEDEGMEQSPAEMGTPQLLRVGAKRKLDASELEEPVNRPTSDGDDFVYQRRQEVGSGTAGKKSSRFSRPPGRETGLRPENTTQSPHKTTSARKILAPKCTNSPSKRRVHMTEKSDLTKEFGDNQSAQPDFRPIRRSKPTTQLEVKRGIENGTMDELQPKTPAPLSDDPLSPISTEPSTRNAHLNKEAAILNSVEDVLNGSIGRGSRRARAAVSYAEPNLRDKMRRPGKELVGAVEGLEKSKEMTATHSRGTSLDRGRSDGESEETLKALKIKPEHTTTEDQWKELPLTSKKDEPLSPLKDKERRDGVRDRSLQSSKEEYGAARVSRKASSSTPLADPYGEALERAVDRLSIFDPPVSSPLEEPRDSAPDDLSGNPVSRRKTPASLASRRHSAQPAATRTPLQSNDSTIGSKCTTRPPPRPNSAAGLRSEASSISRPSSAAGGGLKRSASAASNLRGSNTERQIEDAASERQSILDARAERSAMRRRSMVV